MAVAARTREDSSNGDPLLLAHARDRILARLAGGLPVERELPAFLRLAGRSGALGNASGEHLSTALEELATRIDKTKRKRTPLEAPPHLTGAYVTSCSRYGFARIGRCRARARPRRRGEEGARRRPRTNRGARVLDRGVSARASIRRSPVSRRRRRCPTSSASQLTNLDRVARYKVDRLREASRILEPLDRPDAIGAWIKKEKDSRGPEFAALREITDPVKRAKAVDKLVDAAAANDAERERLIDGIFDVLLELPGVRRGADPRRGRGR